MVLVWGFSCREARASDTLQVQQLLRGLYRTQMNHERYFPVGLFPSYRQYYFNAGVLKKDDNSFFTGLIAFTLRTLRPSLDPDAKMLCDSILAAAAGALPKFQNRRGLPLYSFWQTRPIRYFPNSGVLSLFKANALPDDADCTAICLLATGAAPATAKQVHDYLQGFSNNRVHKVRSTFRAYKRLPAYSTWLSHKVPIDFDVCVLANILYLVHQYQLPYTAADSASLHLISEVVRKREYLTDAVFASPYYNRPSIILYHLSRLMSVATIPVLEAQKEGMIEAAKGIYTQTADLHEKLVLSTALLRWGVKDPYYLPPVPVHAPDKSGFVFFVANMASMLPNPVNGWLTQSRLGRFDYYCPAYNDLLLLENLVWRGR
ncbi:hypothetical protein V9K67_19565 [Paraflavisolibacter sp. H34]|uniref:hypothetical protein n=1 Tax=Huijunlia imazamoxiresistens TaxID=3127457 RepID=UPI003016429D